MLKKSYISNPPFAKEIIFTDIITNNKIINMKRIITLLFAFAIISLSFAQTNADIKVKRMAKEASIKPNPTISIEPRSVQCIWESDFSDASDWNLDHDASDCSLDWEIGQNLECTGFYPIAPIESTDGYYALLDSDAYGGEEGGTEVEDSWLTMANPVDCSGLDNVIVEFDTWYQSYNSERCFIVVSTDGTFPTDLSPTTEADPANGIFEAFPGISGDVQANTGNPSTRRVNISEAAGGQSQVWIRFNWTGTWGYAWFIDRVCIAEQPAEDVSLSYGLVSNNGTGNEYGRTPLSQVGEGMYTGGGAYNFGVNDAENLELSMSIDNSSGYVLSQSDYSMYGFDNDGFLDMSATISGPLASDENAYFEDMTAMSGAVADTYTATFTLTSSGDSEGGEYFGDNTAVREFALTENLYSTDGIDIYENYDVSRLGTGNFTDATDGFMVMSYYEITEATYVAGATIMLDSYMYSSPLTTAGGELVVAIRSDAFTLDSNEDGEPDEAFDVTNTIAESDFYLVTDTDVDNGFITVPLTSPAYLDEGNYYISVEMYSNGDETPIYILDDETIPQPSTMSIIYIPGDDWYTNGTAAAIRMITGESVSLEEASSNLNIYPNPSNGIINIELDKQGDYSIRVNDIVGKLIAEKEINSNSTLDLQHLDTGIYFVNVYNDDVSKVVKVIIE